MPVSGFDLAPHPERLDPLEVDGELPRGAGAVLLALRRHVFTRAIAA